MDTAAAHRLRPRNVQVEARAKRRGTWVYYRARPAILRQLAGLLAVEAPAPA